MINNFNDNNSHALLQTDSVRQTNHFKYMVTDLQNYLVRDYIHLNNEHIEAEA